MSWTPEVTRIVSLSVVRLSAEVDALTEALALATETLRCAQGALKPPHNPDHAENVRLYIIHVLGGLEKRGEAIAELTEVYERKVRDDAMASGPAPEGE